MRSSIAQYTNELVSLTIMALMFVAFIAGQAAATPTSVSDDTTDARQVTSEQAPAAARPLQERLLVLGLPRVRLDFDFGFRHTGE